MSNRPNKLVEQSQALDSFFESLMRDVEAYDENETVSSNEVTLQSVEAEKSIEEKSSKDIDFKEPAQKKSTETIKTSDKPVAPVVEANVETKKEPTKEELAVSLKEPVTDNRIFETLPQVEALAEPAPVIEEKAEPVIIPEEVTPAIIEPERVEAEIKTPETEPELTPLGMPEWAESDFQAMMFMVAGLTLAVPLIELNGIVECDLSEITEMPGSADFYLGLMTYLDKQVPLVDTARFVLPADKIKILAGDDPQERITRVVMIQDCQYGLACDEVNEVITLSPDSVRWRSQRTKRRWLAGTVIEHMCALIDANAFAELLASRTAIQDFRE